MNSRYLNGREHQHLRDYFAGRCGHRKYGVLYDTYPTIISCWRFFLRGRMRYVNLFGFLKECDFCKARFIRWPWWEPPIRRRT